ncbi:MAG: zinc ribbon domain-containing protein [bacterium]
MSNKMCESCLMPLNQDPGKRESDKYCSYCFSNGRLCYEGSDLKLFQQKCYEGMVGHGMNKLKAKLFTWMIRFAPRWKNSK